MPTSLLVGLFLLAVVGANLLVLQFGQIALVFTAWVLVPLDMLCRDVLHTRWRDKFLWLRLSGLVLSGGLLTALLNRDAVWVAAGSCAGFAAALSVNAWVFEAASRRGAPMLTRMNMSNAFAAGVDSVVFPLIAFGTVTPVVSLAQAGSKFAGGVVCSLIFCAVQRRLHVVSQHQDLRTQ